MTETDTKETIVELSRPIEANGETLYKLTLREPCVKDLKSMDGIDGDIAKAVALAAQLARVPPSAIDGMNAKDFAKLSEVVADFLAEPPPTGGTPSAT